MTGPLLPLVTLDGALDGLALVEACVADNDINKQAILASSDIPALVSGLVVVVAALRRSLAVAYGCDLATVDEAIRELLYMDAGWGGVS